MRSDSSAIMHPTVQPPDRIPDEHRDEYRELDDSARALLTPAAFERWTRDLGPDDYTLADVVRAERSRQLALTTLRQGAALRDQQWRVLHLLQRHEGRTVSYLEIARMLWQTPQNRITARSLKAMDVQRRHRLGPLVVSIQVLVHHIRRAIEVDFRRPQHIASMRGVGYRWYSAPPSLDDGENYEQREARHVRDRETMRTLTGIDEPDYDAVEQLGPDGEIGIRSWRPGPELPKLTRRALADGRQAAPDEDA